MLVAVVADTDSVNGELGASGTEGGILSENAPERGDKGERGVFVGRIRSNERRRRRSLDGLMGDSALLPLEGGLLEGRLGGRLLIVKRLRLGNGMRFSWRLRRFLILVREEAERAESRPRL